jgi:hypothetical protein
MAARMSLALLRNHGDQRILTTHEAVVAPVITPAAKRVMPAPSIGHGM